MGAHADVRDLLLAPELEPGEEATVIVTVDSVNVRRTRNRRTLVEVDVSDDDQLRALFEDPDEGREILHARARARQPMSRRSCLPSKSITSTAE